MAREKSPEILELECDCGTAVSGPDHKSVKETMARHKAKAHKEAKSGRGA